MPMISSQRNILNGRKSNKMKNQQPYFKNKEVNWEDLGGGISRQITGHNSNLMLVKVKFEKGAVGALHNHEHTQASYVASGKFKITIDGVAEILEVGDGFFVEPNLKHGAQCLEAGILIDTFNPLRKDFL